ncbi:MAG: carboxypeptidase regulatory-like domain-containing protein [Blastocatellia bacterium]
MDVEILKAAGKAAGIGGVAIVVFGSILLALLKTNIFARLDRDRTYRLLRGVVVSAVAIALAGIAAYVYATTAAKPGVIVYRGSVRDGGTKLPVKDAEVSFLGRADIARQLTDAGGDFSFTMETSGGKFQGTARVLRAGYEVWEKPLALSATTTEEILLKIEPPREFILSGEVRDERGAVAGAEISVEGKDATTVSDAKGRFSLRVNGARAERFTLRAAKPGYGSWREGGIEPRAGIVIVLGKEAR